MILAHLLPISVARSWGPQSSCAAKLPVERKPASK